MICFQGMTGHSEEQQKLGTLMNRGTGCPAEKHRIPQILRRRPDSHATVFNRIAHAVDFAGRLTRFSRD